MSRGVCLVGCRLVARAPCPYARRQTRAARAGTGEVVARRTRTSHVGVRLFERCFYIEARCLRAGEEEARIKLNN